MISRASALLEKCDIHPELDEPLKLVVICRLEVKIAWSFECSFDSAGLQKFISSTSIECRSVLYCAIVPLAKISFEIKH